MNIFIPGQYHRNTCTNTKRLNLKYYKELDGLRGVAALMIMLFHFMPDGAVATHPILHYLHEIGVFGQTGVTLFFALSGFLITRILLNQKSAPHYFRNFYIKRALRIFPLYYLGLIVFYWVLPLVISSPPSPYSSIAYWIYIQNITDTFMIHTNGPQHYWSLAVEEHFYLFWPLFIYYTTVKHTPRLIAGVVAAALICRCLLIYFGYGTFYFTFSIMDGLALGGFLAWYEINQNAFKLKFNTLILVSLLLMLPAWALTGGKGYYWVQIIKFPIISVFYVGVIAKIILGKSWLNNVMRYPFLKFTGKISYGLYVFHPILYMICGFFFPDTNIWISALLCFGSSYLIATISFYGFERHILKLKKHFEPAGWNSKQQLQYK
jgi:peptidoglycan/LPS O-acetylase OafA/YrhL